MWISQYRRDTDLSKCIKWRAAKMIQGMEHLWGDHIVAFKYLKECYKKAGDRVFSRVCDGRTKGNGFKLKERKFRLDIRKKFFTVRVMRYWHRLPREVVNAPSLETPKIRLDGALSNLI